jgi:hypothetical protein
MKTVEQLQLEKDLEKLIVAVEKQGAERMLNLILKRGLNSGFAVSASIDQLWKEFNKKD